MGDQGSSYSILQDIPVMSSLHYRLPKQITIDEIPFLDDALALKIYSFEVEKQTLSNITASRDKMQQLEKELNEKTEKYQAEKLQQQKAEARKIAPGFLDTETRILHPQPYFSSKTIADENYDNSEINHSSEITENNSQQQYQYHHQQVTNIATSSSPVASPPQRFRSSSIPVESNSITNSPHHQHQEKRASSQSHFDYHRFEQGLAPPDPWDTPENDLVALRSILGNNQENNNNNKNNNNNNNYISDQENNNNNYPNNHYPPVSMPSHGSQYPSPYQRPNSTNTYASDAGPWVRPPPPPPNYQQQQQQQQQQTLHNNHHPAPALPPKVYNDTKTNEYMPSQSQPSTPPPPPPPTVFPLPSTSSSLNQQHGYPAKDMSISKPPLLPPLPPNNNIEGLIQELTNMGFTRSQAIDALQKNDNDLGRASNFLLDNT